MSLDLLVDIISLCTELKLETPTPVELTYQIGSNILQTDFPSYTGLPLGCIMTTIAKEVLL